jgi:hypothetical protein
VIGEVLQNTDMLLAAVGKTNLLYSAVHLLESFCGGKAVRALILHQFRIC